MPTRISTKSSSQNVAQFPTHQLARSPFALAIIASAVTYAFSSAAEANDAMDHYEVIEVQGATPLSANSNNSAVFGNVQTLTQDDIEGSVNRSLPELLKTQLASVNLNDVQNNPFQPDLQYRGFTASPLLGLPQGISVYLNGGRVNEAFGDTVHWDLMPLDAIDTVSLYSGSNPLFGQNTLGGALALTTKTGFSFNANEIDLQAGQFGQKAASVESGGHNDHWAYYVNLNHYEEDGWRDYSPSEVQQLFTSLAYKSDKMHLDMNLFMADNELLGNGASPIELLDIEGREAVYTHPDQTNNELTHVNITGDFVLTNTLSLTANMFYRDTQTQSINGDDSDFGACQFADGRVTLCEFEDDDDDDDAPLDSDGDDDDDDDLPVVGEGDDIEAVEFIGFDDDTALAEISDVDADELDGTYNTGHTDAKATGLSFQLAKQYALSGFSSELIVGASYTKGDVNYAADTTFGILENESAQDSRTVLPIDGLMAQEARVRLDVDTTAWSLFFMNSTQLSSAVSLNLGGRFNRDHIVMEDLIDDGEGSLDGNHRFTQFNPAVGVDITIDEQSQLNLAISQSSRTPSPAELSCADEDDPCRLPNGFVADPPLDQVVTQTIEANYTTRIDNIDLMLNVFHSRSKDDIIFQQAGSVASRGYFINVDETQRQGVEFSVGSTWEKLTYRLNYNYLNATYESTFTSFSPFNPQGPDRLVTPGDKIPGQPEHLVKLYADYALTDKARLGAEVILASSQYFRGDEANENEKIDGYVIANIYASYRFNDTFTASLRVNNVFDKDYETFGTYGEADEVLEDIYPDVDGAEFVGPAQPRMVSVNLKARF
ncbi:TonB-dependent receptor [Alteromonas mediterranea]|uniref:TonB-dependent receptor n=1 Tax=Alteromonas mediterranea TaxID=314275 RepID=A0AAC8XM26_9ALTE|nr:TonB-dependent receptor [Alteromonas mediterranea]AFV86778.1 TonB-dependent receptor [Alteromonas mediterranea DE1]AGP98791.1 TonB-dependent receptor [Alteromonas mediterranea UM7]AGQ02992.1 TonB-dependent receptor [Alteromonas mediterranea UM4b]AMJ79722.1 TonB-dependent receptor [Alteromonas mediterranea]AMJ83880.1 TonB-dependent receptor [Alteromonas mediterranea]